MSPTLLTLLSFSITLLMIATLKVAFRCIEKAHAKPRKPGPRTSGVQPMRERSL